MITAEHEKRIREHYTNLKAHPELIDLIIKRTNEETNTPSEAFVGILFLFVFFKTLEGSTYWHSIDSDVNNFKPSTTLRSNYFEMVQAVKEGKRLQFRGCRGEGVWSNDLTYSNLYSKELVLLRLLTDTNLEYRIKPELKVFKYSTRVFKCVAGYLTLWSSNQLTSQKEHEQTSFFVKWVGDTVEHTVEYEE